MKKIYFSLFALTGLLSLSACSSDDSLEQENGELSTTTITVKVPGDFNATRAGATYTNSGKSGYQNLGSGGTVYLSVYPEDGNGEADWTGQAPLVNGQATFSPKGFRGSKVKFVGYATVGNKTLSSDDLKKISVTNDLNDESLDCFSGSEDGVFGTTESITLTRPNCKVRLVCKDWDEAQKWVKEIESVDMTTSDSKYILPYTNFNAVTGSYTDDATDVTRSSSDIPTYTSEANGSRRTLLVDYIPVNAGEIVNTPTTFNIKFKDLNGEEQTKTLKYINSSLPLKRNRLVTAEFSFLDAQDFTVKIDDNFDDEVEITTVDTPEELTKAIEDGAENIQLTSDINYGAVTALSLAQEQTIDLNNHTLTTQDVNVNKEGSNVNIKNGDIKLTGEDAKLNVNTKNSTVTIENVKLTSNATHPFDGGKTTTGQEVISIGNIGDGSNNTVTIRNSEINISKNRSYQIGITLLNSNTLNIENTTINHSWFGITQQGIVPGSTINLNNTNIIGTWAAIYLSNKADGQKNTLTINGGQFTSDDDTPIEVKKTDITVKNATITAKKSTQTYSFNGGGTGSGGYGIALVGYQKGKAYEGTTLFENNTFNLAAGANAVKIGKYDGKNLVKVE